MDCGGAGDKRKVNQHVPFLGPLHLALTCINTDDSYR